MPVKLTASELELITNWDQCRPHRPFRNELEESSYYARYLEQMLFRYLLPTDWERIKILLPKMKLTPKIKHFVAEVVLK